MAGWLSRLMRVFGSDIDMNPDAGGNDDPTRSMPYIGPEDKDFEDLFYRYQHFMTYETNRVALYDLYDAMDTTDVVGIILDEYADAATQIDPEVGRTIWVESKNAAIQDAGNETFDRLGTEEEITAIARDVAKYGDFYMRNIYAKGSGLRAWHATWPKLVSRVENKVHKLLGYEQKQKKFRRQTSKRSYPWDYVHFRLRGRDARSIYGTSILYHMIRPWRQFILAEDHALLYQMSMHPDRNLYLIDIGSMDEYEAQKAVNKFKSAVRRHQHLDPKGQKFDHRFNAITPYEDVFLGVRRDSNTRVEKLPGSGNAQEVTNLEYYRSKLFSAGKTDKGAFGYDSRRDYNPKAQLTNQDIRFARSVRRLQRSLRHGYRTAVIIDLIMRMKDPERDAKLDWRRDGSEFKVKMAQVGFLEEMEMLELQQLRYQIADQMIQSARGHEAYNSHAWVRYVMKTYLKLSDAKIKKLLVGQKKATDREDMTFGAPRMMGAQAAAQAAAYGQGPEAGAEAQAGAEEVPAESMLSPEERERLDEIAKNDPEVRKLIEKGIMLFETDRQDQYTYKGLDLDEEELNLEDLADDVEEILHEED